MTSNRLLAVLAALLLLGAAGLFVGSHVELKRVTRVIPPASYVKADRYFALAQILAPTSTVKRYEEPSKIDLSKSSLVVIDGTALAHLGKERLTHWIARGGRLLVTLPNAAAAPAASWWRGKGPFAGLAPRFEGAARAGGQTSKGHPTSRRSTSRPPKSAAKRPVVLVDVTVSFPEAKRGKNTTVVSYDGVAKLAVRYWGKGELIVCGEPLFLANRNLVRDDDLQFASALFGGLMEHPGGVVWLPSPPVPSVRPSRRIAVKPILVAGLLVFLLLVWMKSPRFGPTLPEPDEDNRSLRLRFRAEGRFLWKYGAGNWIVERLHGVRRDRELLRNRPTHEVRVAHESSRRRPTRHGFIEEVTALETHIRSSLENRRAKTSIGR